MILYVFSDSHTDHTLHLDFGGTENKCYKVKCEPYLTPKHN